MKKQPTSLSRHLLISIAVILFITLSITSFWLLHETLELVRHAINRALQQNILLTDYDPFHWEIVSALLIPAASAFVVSLLASWFAIRHIVSPLQKLTEELKHRNVTEWIPFESDNRSHEVQAITQALNDLLERMQLAFTRERQFTSDVSHELRTPIAGIRLNLELLSMQLPEETAPLIARLDDMQRTIDQLLTMARLEQKIVTGFHSVVDLVQDVILPSESELQELLQAGNQTLRLSLPDSAYITGDAILLKMLLRNLIENSSRYADPNTCVNIILQEDSDGFHLIVLDAGAGVDETKMDALTQAFQRFDQRGKGVGLGLNIVARICNLHQAKLNISNNPEPKGMRVEIIYPAIK